MSLSMNRALAIAAHLGMPVRRATKADYIVKKFDFAPGTYKAILFSWTGECLIVTPKRKAIDVLHETCHWLVASEAERKMAEFGLGSAPYDDVTGPDEWERFPSIDDTDFRETELREVWTCCLELQLLAACGGNWRRRADYLNFEPPKRGDFWDWIRREREYPAESPLFARSYAESLATATKHAEQVMRRARAR